MAFLLKLNAINKKMDRLRDLIEETQSRHQMEGISDPDILKPLDDLLASMAPVKARITDWLEDKQSQIEELEFLTEGFRREYGSVLDYKKFASLVKNPELKERLAAYGKEETLHAKQLSKLIFEHGGTPEYTFTVDKEKDGWGPEQYLDYFVDQEKAAVRFYQNGEEKFQDAKFLWLLGEIKTEEKEHLKELQKLKEEFLKKEIVITMDPDFKWVDPFMGEPGDRAWIE